MPLCTTVLSPSITAPVAESGEARALPGCPGWGWRLLPSPTAATDLLTGNLETAGNFWLQPGTRAFLQENDFGFTTRYVELVESAGGRRLVTTLQSFDFSPTGNVSDSAKGATSRADLRRRLLAPFSFPVLVIGQLLNSGPYAATQPPTLAGEQVADLLTALATALQQAQPTRAVIIKDFFRTGDLATTQLIGDGYYSLPVDPVMELSIPKTWSSLDDYLIDLSSKYRVRYRRARTKFNGLTSRSLTREEAHSRSQELYELYLITSKGASFNGVQLSPEYFAWVAAQPGPFPILGDLSTGSPSSSIVGYFDGDDLVGFASAIINGAVLHAHYLGLRDEYKYSHHLYHNVLYDLLAAAIASGCTKVDYGRTALEIKSSLGAVPVEYTCLIKARSSFFNKLIPVFTPAVYTAASWQQRNPFRS